MTKLLKQVFAKVSALPATEQNLIARWVLEELNSEKCWEAAFAESENDLSELAREALLEHKQRKTKLLNLKKL